ncbi:MAG: hypothetical protein J4469_03705 [Candidatus Aenigmarchaeota archaeon]|nr:hypothetical protein [Candidatus Aenigmarchaeota archaeon]
MDEITCVLGKKIKFTKERYLHIVLRHPELEGKESDIRKTVTNADFVQESVYDKNVLLYYRNINRKEYVVVIIKVLNNHGFIITAYIANIIKKGAIIWKK